MFPSIEAAQAFYDGPIPEHVKRAIGRPAAQVQYDRARAECRFLADRIRGHVEAIRAVGRRPELVRDLGYYRRTWRLWNRFAHDALERGAVRECFS